MNVHWPPVDDGTTTYRPTADRSRLANGKHGGDDPVAGHFALDVTFDAINLGINGITQSRGTFSNRIEHGPNIRRRTSNYAQDFTRGSLLFQCFGEFLEKPHIFDGDDGLIGKGFEKGNL